MRKKSALLTFILLFASILNISTVHAGAYQSTCPAKKLAELEAQIRKDFNPRKKTSQNDGSSGTLSFAARSSAILRPPWTREEELDLQA